MNTELIQRLIERGNRLLNLEGWEDYGKDMLEAAKELQQAYDDIQSIA